MLAQQVQPSFEKALFYTRHLVGIASGTQAEFARAAEDQLSEASRNISKMVDEAARNAPAGSENVAALVKTALNTASTSYEQLSKTTKDAGEAIEASIIAAASRLAPDAAKQS
jgi:hypothetical protein